MLPVRSANVGIKGMWSKGCSSGGFRSATPRLHQLQEETVRELLLSHIHPLNIVSLVVSSKFNSRFPDLEKSILDLLPYTAGTPNFKVSIS